MICIIGPHVLHFPFFFFFFFLLFFPPSPSISMSVSCHVPFWLFLFSSTMSQPWPMPLLKRVEAQGPRLNDICQIASSIDPSLYLCPHALGHGLWLMAHPMVSFCITRICIKQRMRTLCTHTAPCEDCRLVPCT